MAWLLADLPDIKCADVGHRKGKDLLQHCRSR